MVMLSSLKEDDTTRSSPDWSSHHLRTAKCHPAAKLTNWISFSVNLCFKTSNYVSTPAETSKMSPIIKSGEMLWALIKRQPKGQKLEAQQFASHSSVGKFNYTTLDIFLESWRNLMEKSYSLNYHLKLISLIPICFFPPMCIKGYLSSAHLCDLNLCHSCDRRTPQEDGDVIKMECNSFNRSTKIMTLHLWLMLSVCLALFIIVLHHA